MIIFRVTSGLLVDIFESYGGIVNSIDTRLKTLIDHATDKFFEIEFFLKYSTFNLRRRGRLPAFSLKMGVMNFMGEFWHSKHGECFETMVVADILHKQPRVKGCGKIAI